MCFSLVAFAMIIKVTRFFSSVVLCPRSLAHKNSGSLYQCFVISVYKLKYKSSFFPDFYFFLNDVSFSEVLQGLSNVPTYPVKSTYYNRRKLRIIDLFCDLINLGR